MRFLVFALILSILFSGYATVAHAFVPVSNGKGQIESTTCHDRYGQTHSDDKNDKGKSDGNCIACHHCCSGQLAFISAVPFDFTPISSVLASIYLGSLSGEHAFSLLRPPKSLF